MTACDEIARRFADIRGLSFRELAPGVIAACIQTPLAVGMLSLYGGHIVDWHPANAQHPVLWTSEHAVFEPGKAIRGGAPICWPWFGSHPNLAGVPGHGYARLSQWDLDSAAMNSAGEIELTLSMGTPALTTAMLPLSLSLRIVVGSTLQVALTTRNEGSRSVRYTEGLHTYFQVGDIERVEVLGLEGAEYIDLVNGNSSRVQAGPIKFSAELGRIFTGSTATCLIADPVLGRLIRIEKSGSQSTAVWNPWLATASKMPDLGVDGWKEMVCVESANALGDVVTLSPGDAHTLVATYSTDILR